MSSEQSAAKKDVILETDAAAIALARNLMRSARFGALATLTADGAPQATRVACATDSDGTPIILVSSLSAHTACLEADPRCSLLVGEPGKGDPLAHPRLSLSCHARRIQRDTAEGARIRRRYLNRQPKAALYADFADFFFFRLELSGAGLNGGFARAYKLERGDLLCDEAFAQALAAAEQGAIDHMNADHGDAVEAYARHFAKADGAGWKLTGIDPDGLDLSAGGRVVRVSFATPLERADDLRPVLVAMAREARGAGETR